MLRTVIVTTLLLVTAPAFAKLYKCTDADGNISYTDEPCAGGEELKLPPLPTYTTKKPATSDTAEPEAREQHKGYTRFVITQPENDKQIQSTTGKVGVLIALEPGLNVSAGHKIQIKVDGKALPTTGTTTRVQLNNIERGTHTLQAMILDEKGAIIEATSVIKFHVVKKSVLEGVSPETPIYETDKDGNIVYDPDTGKPVELDEQSTISPQKPQGALPAQKAPTTLPRIPKPASN